MRLGLRPLARLHLAALLLRLSELLDALALEDVRLRGGLQLVLPLELLALRVGDRGLAFEGAWGRSAGRWWRESDHSCEWLSDIDLVVAMDWTDAMKP